MFEENAKRLLSVSTKDNLYSNKPPEPNKPLFAGPEDYINYGNSLKKWNESCLKTSEDTELFIADLYAVTSLPKEIIISVANCIKHEKKLDSIVHEIVIAAIINLNSTINPTIINTSTIKITNFRSFSRKEYYQNYLYTISHGFDPGDFCIVRNITLFKRTEKNITKLLNLGHMCI